MPEAVGALVEIGHGQIERDGLQLLGAAAPDGLVGEEALVYPGVAVLEFFGGHVLRAEDGVAGVVAGPVFVEDAALGFHLCE